MALPSQDATSVGILGGDPVVGRALEQLLRSAGYAARFLTETSLDETWTLDGLKLLLFTDDVEAGRRESALGGPKSALKGASLPILELAASPDGSKDGAAGVLPWPCRVDELRERIEAALLVEQRPSGEEGGDGQGLR